MNPDLGAVLVFSGIALVALVFAFLQYPDRRR